MDEFDNWDDDPLDDMDFDMDFDSPPKGSKFKRFMGGFFSGAKDNIFTKETLQTVLPSSFKNTFQNASVASYKLKELQEEFKKENAQAAQDLQYLVGRGLSKFKAKLPNRIANGLDDFTQKDFSSWEGSSYSDNAPSMDGVSDNDVTNSIQDTANAVDQQTSVLANLGETIVDTMGRVGAGAAAGLKVNASQLVNINTSLNRLLDYQVKVQARNDAIKIRLLSSMQMLNAKYYKFMEASMHRSISELKTIALNSAKSDYEKTSHSEYLRQQVRNSIFSTAQRSIGGIGGFLAERLGKDGRQDKYSQVGGLLGQLRMGAEMTEGMPIDYAEMAGSMLSQFLITQAPYMIQSGGAQQIISKLKTQFPEQNKQLTNFYKFLTKVGHATSYATNNYKGIINSQIGSFAFDDEEDMTYEDYVMSLPEGKKPLPKSVWWSKKKAKGLTNKGLSKVIDESMAPVGSRIGVRARSVKDLLNPTPWTNLEKRTLNEVIPGMLAKIHLSMEKMRTGNDNLKEESYNFQRSKFLSASDNKQAVRNTLFNKNDFNNQADSVLGIVSSIDKDGTLSDEAKKHLAMRLAKDADAEKFNPYMLANFEGEGIDKKTADEISQLIRRSFGLEQEDIDSAMQGSYADRIMKQSRFKSESGSALANNISERLNSLKAWRPDISEKLDLLRYTGQEEELIRQGLLRYENGNLYFNDKAVDDRLSESITGRLNKDSEYNRMYSADGYQRRAAEIKAKTKNIKGVTLAADSRSIDEIIRDLQDQDRKKKELEEYNKAQSKFKPVDDEDGLPTLGGTRSHSTKNVFNFNSEELQKSLDELTKQLGSLSSNFNKGKDGQADFKEITSRFDTSNGLLQQILSTSKLQEEKITQLLNKGIEVNLFKQGKKAGGTRTGTSEDTETIKKSFFDRIKDTNLKGMFNSGVDKLMDNNPLILGGLLGGLGAIAVENPKVAMILGAGAVIGAGYMRLKDAADGRFPNDDEDIYVEGEKDPILESRRLKNGDYYDMATKFVIKTWKDVTGTVIDVGGRVVATAKTLGQKLMTIDGRAIIMAGLDKIKTGLITAFNFVDPATRLKRFGDYIKGKIYQQDVYIAGEKDPVLKGSNFSSNKYFKEKDGQLVAIHGWNEIDGAVYDDEGNVLITETEYESGLRTTSGMKIDTIKKGVGLAGSLGRSALMRFGLRAKEAAGKTGRAAVNALSNDYTPITNSVDRIYKLMVSHWGYTGTPFDIPLTPTGGSPAAAMDKVVDGAPSVPTGKRRSRLSTKGKDKGKSPLPFETPQDDQNSSSSRFNSLKYKEQQRIKKEESESRGALIRMSDWFTKNDKNKDKKEKKGSFLSSLMSGLGFALLPLKAAFGAAGISLGAVTKLASYIPAIATGIFGVGRSIIGVISGLLDGKAGLSAIDGMAAAAADSISAEQASTAAERNGAKKKPGGKERSVKGRKPSLVRGLFKANNKAFGAAFKQAGRSGRAVKSIGRAGWKGAKWLGSLGGGAVGRFGMGMGAAGLGGAASLLASGLSASHSIEPDSMMDSVVSGLGTAGNVLGTMGMIDSVLAMAGSSLSLTGMATSAIGGGLGVVMPMLLNPYVLTAVLVGGTAYMAYKYYSRGKGSQLPLRLAQYGLSDPDSDFSDQIIKIEKALNEYVVVTNETAKLSDKAPLEKLFSPILGTISDETLKKNFIIWFNYRFKPVFLMTHSTIKTAGFKSLEDYDEAKGAEVYQAAKACHDSMGSFNPHPYTVSFTFDPKMELMNKAQTLAKVNDYLGDLKTYSERHGGTKEEIIDKGTSKVKSAKGLEEQLKKSEAEDNWFTDKDGNLGIWDRRQKREELQDMKDSDAKLPKKIDVSDMIPESGIVEPVTSMRLAAYGNTQDIPWRCQVVLKMERWCEPYLFMDNGQVSFKVKTEDVYNAFKGSFDADGWFEDDRWMTWFNYRFLPVLKSWYGFCNKLRNGIPSLIWKSLSATNCFDFGRELAELKIMVGKNLVSIWSIDESPFSRFGRSADFSAKGRLVLKALEMKAKDAKLRDPQTEKARSQSANVSDLRDAKHEVEQRAQAARKPSSGSDPTKNPIPGISRADQFTGSDNGYTSPTSYGSGDSAFDKYANTMSKIKEPPPLKNVNQKAAEKALYTVATAHGLKGKELAMFMAQCAEESGNFSTFVENTKYSPANMVKIWPNRFPNIQAAQALHSQGEQAVVNSIYGGRNGNRPGTSDGWDYRGRGYIQLTGRNNYALAAREIGDPRIIQHPELVGSDLTLGAEASLGWWLGNQKARLAAQAGDLKMNTKAVNGGYTNYEKRLSYYNKYLKLVENGNLDKMMAMEGSSASAATDGSKDQGTAGYDPNSILSARKRSMDASKPSEGESGATASASPTPGSGGDAGGSAMMGAGGGGFSMPGAGTSSGKSTASPAPSPITASPAGEPPAPPVKEKPKSDPTPPPAQEIVAKTSPELLQQNAAIVSLLQQINTTLANQNKGDLSKVKI